MANRIDQPPPLLKSASASLRGLLNSSHSPVRSEAECVLRNDRQSYFRMARNLVRSQFTLGDRELSSRLWKWVSDRDMDLGRIVNLVYCCPAHDDDDAMLRTDEGYMELIDEPVESGRN